MHACTCYCQHFPKREGQCTCMTRHEVYECDLERNYEIMKEVILNVHSLWALGVPVLGEFEEP